MPSARSGQFDCLADGGEQEDVLEMELGETGGQEVSFFSDGERPLDDDPPFPVQDAETAPPGQFLGGQRGVRHGDLQSLCQSL